MRLWLAALTVSVLLLGCTRSFPGQEPDDPAAVEDTAVSVRVIRVVADRVREPFETTGNLVPLKRSVLYAQVDGTVTWVARSPRPLRVSVDGVALDYPLNVDIGVPVQKGQPVIRLEQRPYELAVREAQKRLLAAQRELERLLSWQRAEEIRRLRAAVRAARAEAELEKSTLQRYQRLRERGAISDEEYERQRTRAQLAAARYEQIAAQLDIAESGPTAEEVAVARAAVEQAEAALEIARYRLERTTIRAPYDGVITEMYVSEGEHVLAAPRTKLFEIVMDQVLVAQVNVPERYVGLIEPGERVQLFVANQREPIEGTVAFVNGKVDHLTRTFRVRIGVDNRKRRFKPGQFVRVRFYLEGSEERPTVLVEAVRYREGDPMVFVVEGSTVHARSVRLGLRGEHVAEVLEGLEEGEVVVLEPVDLMADGMQVRLQRVEAAQAVRTAARREGSR